MLLILCTNAFYQAYSIEFIRCEGLHLQLELASTLEQRVSLNDKLQASARKKEVRPATRG